MYSFLPTALALLSLGMAVNAQQPPPAPDPTAQVPPATSQPGSPPSGTPDNPGATSPTPETQTPPPSPEVIPSEPPPPPESTGPGILSRGFSVTPLENQNVRFRPYLSFSGLSDSGLTSFSPNNPTQILSNQSYGIDGGFGIEGRRVFKKDTFELEFRGDAFHYTPASQYDGGNYFLNLSYQHYLTKHISIALTESASLYTNNYTVLNSVADLSVGGTQFGVSPNTQLFDTPTLSFSTGVDMVIQKTSRLSFDLGGTGFLVRRTATSLYGTIGSQARADMSYRLTRRMTVGGYYAYSNYDFNKAFGGSDVETGGLIFSYTIAKGLELRLRGGASYVQTSGIQTITIDPVIAAILGYSTGTAVVRSSQIVPDISAQISKTHKLGTASAEFIESVTPGNGLYLTSRHVGFSAHYDYTGIRRWTFSIGGSRDTLSTLGILIGEFTSNDARAGVSRVLAKGFQATAFVEYRHYDVSEASFLRNSYRLQVGFAWTPSDRPLRLW